MHSQSYHINITTGVHGQYYNINIQMAGMQGQYYNINIINGWDAQPVLPYQQYKQLGCMASITIALEMAGMHSQD